MPPAVIVSVKRTAIGKFPGCFSEVSSTELGAAPAAAAIEAPGLKGGQVDGGLKPGDFDLVERNEAFAAQVLACDRELGLDRERLNFIGGAIAPGRPIEATGARIVVTLLHEMRRRGARRGLATICVSGGLGMAVAFEREA